MSVQQILFPLPIDGKCKCKIAIVSPARGRNYTFHIFPKGSQSQQCLLNYGLHCAAKRRCRLPNLMSEIYRLRRLLLAQIKSGMILGFFYIFSAQGLSKLQFLNMDSNNISAMAESTFQNLDHLSHLILSHNPLMQLHNLDLFAARPTSVDLSSSHLQSVPNVITRYVRDLRLPGTVYISNKFINFRVTSSHLFAWPC